MNAHDELRDYRLDKLEKAHEKQADIIIEYGKHLTALQTKMIIIGASVGGVSAFVFSFLKDLIK